MVIYPIEIQINGISQGMRVDAGKPYIENGTTMVPLAFVSESLGHQTEWKASSKQVIIDGGKVVLTVGSKNVIVDKKSVTLSTPPAVKNGRTYVPLRFISSALGYGADYKNNKVNITTKGSGNGTGASNSAANPLVNIDQYAKNKGYQLVESKSVDLNKDGIKDYIAVVVQSWEGYLVIVDGATGDTLATEQIFPGEHGTDLNVSMIQGSHHIMITTYDKQPWQGLYEWRDGKLKNHKDVLGEKFDIKLLSKDTVQVQYPQSVYNQNFAISNNIYLYLAADMSWYPHSVGTIENGVLTIDKEIRLTGMNNSGQFQTIEKYNWNGSNWVLGEVIYNSYSNDFKKTSREGLPQETQNILDWVAQGRVDTIPYKVGDPISKVINVLGEGNPRTMQGIRIRTYGNYHINESLYEPVIAGFAFGPGFKLYGITIGDSAKEIESKLGKTYTKSSIEEGDELSPDDAVYNQYYEANNSTLKISFDKNNKSLSGWFLSR